MSVMVMRTPAYSGMLAEENKHIFHTNSMQLLQMLHLVNLQSLPPHREQIESYCTANDLLHV